MILGVIGIVVPLLPTVPFLLLAAYCYARGSEQFYHWLMEHPWFGTILKNYKEGKGIPFLMRMYAALFLWITIGISIVFILESATIKLIVFVVAMGVTAHLIMMKGKG